MIRDPHATAISTSPASLFDALAGGVGLPYKAGLFDPSEGEPFGPAYDSVGLECSCENQGVEIAKRWAATDAKRRKDAWLIVLHKERVIASFPPGSYP